MLIEQTEQALEAASAELAERAEYAEKSMEAAVAANEAVVEASKNIDKLKGALAALRGESIEQPSPATPVVSQDEGSAGLVSDSLPEIDPTIAQRDSNIQIANSVSEAYKAPDPVKFRKDDPAALAAAKPAGQMCGACGRHGTLAQYQKPVNDRGPFIFIGCTSCGSERMVG